MSESEQINQAVNELGRLIFKLRKDPQERYTELLACASTLLFWQPANLAKSEDEYEGYVKATLADLADAAHYLFRTAKEK